MIAIQNRQVAIKKVTGELHHETRYDSDFSCFRHIVLYQVVDRTRPLGTNLENFQLIWMRANVGGVGLCGEERERESVCVTEMII